MAGDDLISVVIPAFNAERTLDATLSSVSRQTYRNLEIAVVDDGSTDGTAEIARRHAAEDERIQVISIANAGVANARNTGIAATIGPFVALIDSDDVWRPEKLAVQMRAMAEGGEDVGYVYCRSRRIDAHGRVLRDLRSHPLEGRIYLRSIVYNPVSTASSILARRSAIERAGGFLQTDPEVQGSEDNLLQIMMNRTWLARAVPLYLTGYRESANSLSSDPNHVARCRLAVLRHVAERFPETPAEVLSLAEGRLRAVLATRLLRLNRAGQGLAELARACRLAPLCSIEIASVDSAARIIHGLRWAVGRSSDRNTRAGKDFFQCDPKPSAELSRPRFFERRLLDSLGKSEEAFVQSARSASNYRLALEVL